MKVKIYTDGGARGNPGPAASAFIVYENEKEVFKQGDYLGETTNNVAEYTAVAKALEFLTTQLDVKEVDFFLDSLLVKEQLVGKYKIKNENMRYFASKIKDLEKNFSTVTYTHIRREENKAADTLVNATLDEAQDN